MAITNLVRRSHNAVMTPRAAVPANQRRRDTLTVSRECSHARVHVDKSRAQTCLDCGAVKPPRVNGVSQPWGEHDDTK